MSIEHVTPEELEARVENFKEKTGLDDEDIRKILQSEELTYYESDDFENYEFEKDMFFSTPDEWIQDFKRGMTRSLTSPETLEAFDKAKWNTSFTSKQIAGILEGAGDSANTALEQLSTRAMFAMLRKINTEDEMFNEGDPITDASIAEALRGTHIDVVGATRLLAQSLYQKEWESKPQEKIERITSFAERIKQESYNRER